MSDNTYSVLSPIRHNGELYKPGRGVVINLADDEAERLRDLGAIGEPIGPTPEPNTTTSEETALTEETAASERTDVTEAEQGADAAPSAPKRSGKGK